MTLRLGIVGCGNQVRQHYLPYLGRRHGTQGDVEVVWMSGWLPQDKGLIEQMRQDAALGALLETARFEPDEGWRRLLDEGMTDAVLVSLPNSLHAEPIESALSCGCDVAVDKPTTVAAADCRRLVDAAREKALVFATLCQRRYEHMYQTVKEIIQAGRLGDVRLVDYLIIHEYYGLGRPTWENSRKLAGGGALISSGYHALDTVLWLLSFCPEGPVRPVQVSARWMLDDSRPADDAIETVADVRVVLSNGGIFNLAASFEGPEGSLDENIKMFGSNGAVRILRDRPQKTDMSAGTLSYQHRRGMFARYQTDGWTGLRWAPLEDFLDAAVRRRKHGKAGDVLSPAGDSLQVVTLIEKAYESARENGKAIEVSA